MIQFFRANPGAMIATMLLAIGALVFGLIGLMMHRGGVSVRPIVFIAGFFGIIVVPQALFHFSQALGWIPKKDLVWVAGSSNNTSLGKQWRARDDLLDITGGRFAQPQAIYGDAVDPALISDVRERLAQLFGAASAAEMAVFRDGSTATIAQFSNNNDAENAASNYARAMLGTLPPLDGDGTRTVTRTSDVVKLVVAGRTMIAYSAANAASAQKMLASAPIVSQAKQSNDGTPQEFWLYRLYVLIPLILLIGFAAILWFFKMSSWASEVVPAANAEPVSASTLRERLLSVNDLDVPFRVAPSESDSSLLVVTWRYADAKWIDLARAHGMRRTHRILLKLDEKHSIVRPTEQMSQLDWDAGAYGGVSWATQRGITFFQYQQTSVFGLQLDSNNKFTPQLSYTYRFNVQEMKAPFIKAVTQSGWTWRPTVALGPAWLSWLTE